MMHNNNKELLMKYVPLVFFVVLLLSCINYTEVPVSNLEIVDHTKKEKIVIAVTGDTGTGGSHQYKVGQTMYKVCQSRSCDFVLIAGDNIYEKGVKNELDSQFKTKFEDPYAHFGRFDFWMILGNHDRGGNNQAQIDYSLKSPRWRMLNTHYAIPKLPSWLHMYGVDRYEASSHKRHAENFFCNRDGWKIMFAHHPIYSNGKHGRSSTMRRNFLPMIKNCNVNMFLSGHDHDLEHISSPDFEQIVSGAGGKLRSVKKSNDNVIKQRFIASKYGFVVLELTEYVVDIYFYDELGNILHHYIKNRL